MSAASGPRARRKSGLLPDLRFPSLSRWKRGSSNPLLPPDINPTDSGGQFEDTEGGPLVEGPPRALAASGTVASSLDYAGENVERGAVREGYDHPPRGDIQVNTTHHYHGETHNTTNVSYGPTTKVNHAQNVNLWQVHYFSKRLAFIITVLFGVMAFSMQYLTQPPQTNAVVDNMKLLDTLPPSPETNALRSEYLPGSRADDEAVVKAWVESPSAELVLWINAPAGTGKSTFARYVKTELRSINRLGASIFFGTLPSDTWSPETVVRSIGGEIGRIHHKAVPRIGQAILDTHATSLQTHLEMFIRDAILSLNLTHPLVIVMDGFDQWKSHQVLAKQLAFLNPHSSSVRFLMLSRSPTRGPAFESISIKNYRLQPISQAVMQEYFNQRFGLIDWDYGRKPHAEDVARLAEKSGGLFIWSATVCSLIEDSRSTSSPQETLTAIVNFRLSVGETDRLARLYSDVITHLFPKAGDRRTLMFFMSVTMVLQEPLPLSDFSSLIGVRPKVIKSLQADLGSLQTWQPPASRAMVYPAAKLFHLSFIEYLQSDSATRALTSTVSLEQAHATLGEATLRELTRFLPISRDIGTLYLSPLRNYVVKYWPMHVSEGTPSVKPSSDSDWEKTPHSSILRQTTVATLSQWATVFLNGIEPGTKDTFSGNDTVGVIRGVASRLSEGGSSTTSLEVSCLEVAVRLGRRDTRSWHDLGKALSRTAEYTMLPAYLDQGVTAHRYALETWGQSEGHRSDTDESTLLYSLGASLYFRFKVTGSMDDLNEAISMYRCALKLRPLGHPEHAPTLGKLTYSLGFRFELVGDASDLEEAIKLCRETLGRLPKGGHDRPIILNSLAITLLTCFRQIGCTTDLEEIIASYRESLGLLPPHPEESAALQGLAIAIHSRFQQTHSIKDIDEIVDLERRALALRPQGHPDHSPALNNLAFSLCARYELRGDAKDLEESIKLGRESLVFRPPGHPKRPYTLDTLALALRFRQEDLDESLDLINEALRVTPPNHSNLIMRLHSLATILLSRYQHLGIVADLEEATFNFHRVFELCPQHHFIRPKLHELKERLDEEWASLPGGRSDEASILST